MTDFPVLKDLGYVVVAATLFLMVARAGRLPSILAYMAAGLVLGPATGLLAVSESVTLFSHLGVALLLFVAGLELGVEKIRAVGRAAVLGGALQVAATTGLGYGIALALGFSGFTALLLGLATAFSSTVVVVRLLDGAGNLDALHGRLAIGVLLVQDVAVAVVLTVVSGLAGGGGDAAHGGGSAAGLSDAFVGIGILVAASWLGTRFVARPLFHWMASSVEGAFIAGLTWAFAFILGAEILHVSIELGALIAGVGLAQLPHMHELRRRIHPLVDLFLAIFFVSLGAGMDPAAALQLWPAALVLSAFVLLVKPLLTAFILSRLGQDRPVAFLAGLTLGQVSEFALILAGMAAAGGLIGPDVLALVAVVALITIGVSALAVPSGPALLRRAERAGMVGFLPDRGTPAPPAPARQGHVVVVGMNTLGRHIVQELAARGWDVVAVDTDPEKLSGLPAPGLVGSADSPLVLEEAEVARARLVVSALQIEDANALLAHRCHGLGVPVSVHAWDPSLAHELLEIGAEHVMISKLDGIRDVTRELQTRGVFG